MQVDFINPLLFAFHSILLLVKLYLVYFLFNQFTVVKSTVKESYLITYAPMQVIIFIFSLLIVLSEINFIFSFYEVKDLYWYECLAITDQVIFSTIVISLLKRSKDG